MKKNIIIVSNIIFLVILFFNSCDNKPVDRSLFKDEMEDRELMRVTAGELNDFAFRKGVIILDSLQKASKSDTNFNNLAFKLWLEQEMDFKIEQLSISQIDTNSKLYQVSQAYQYNVENKIPCEDNLQKNGENMVFITRAFVDSIDNKLILNKIIVINMPKKELIKKMTIKDLKIKK
ncbi:MAG: hypothetical protein EAZ27_04330 [Cytophagales bacterium]|nr:MAG: hypothetical protein EAZ27_04330 [Cytophagales bacterium]